MLYCPNCCAYQYDAGATSCRKCGYDFSLHKEKKVQEKKEEVKKNIQGFDDSVPCRICGSPTRILEKEMELKVEGDRINISGLKLMGGEITKRTASSVEYHIWGRECSEGHPFYGDVGFRIRQLCPMCYGQMMKYGSSLYSCSRCNKHFPINDWPDPDPEETLRNEGWESLEG